MQRDGAIAYVLSIGIPTKKFAETMTHTQLPPEMIVTIIDRNNVAVARSQKHEEFSGAKLRNDFASTHIAAAGIDRGINREGIAFQWTWRRSEASGWLIAVGVTEAVLNAPYWRALSGYGAAGGLLLAVAMTLAYFLGGRISQSAGALGVDRAPTQEEFRVLFDSAPTGVVDGNGIIVLVNARMEAEFGYARSELIGQSVELLVPGRNRKKHSGLRKAYSRAPESRPMGAGRDLYGLRKDGSEFPIEIGLNPIATLDGKFTMTTVVDITARKHAELELAAALADRNNLRRRIMQAQEDERLRLARDLHDQTGQALAAAMLELKNLESVITDSGRDRLRSLRGQLNQIGKDLHRVAWQLRPASIDDLGLRSALADYISEWGAQNGIKTDFHCPDPDLEALPEDMRTTLYRVIQEGLTNITKHARSATSASVLVGRTEDTLRLTIMDDGCGFQPAAQVKSGSGRLGGGLGLPGMRERLALIGGELEIESSTDGGATIFARIPLKLERVVA